MVEEIRNALAARGETADYVQMGRVSVGAFVSYLVIEFKITNAGNRRMFVIMHDGHGFPVVGISSAEGAVVAWLTERQRHQPTPAAGAPS